ncbi:MAG: hypothetical protein ACLQNE_08030 [Thermoguttaceae bacterium]|jgi:hypothetical protein
MALPRFHSFTWSDREERGGAAFADRDETKEEPRALVDKELCLWVTYPGERSDRKKGKKAKHRRSAKKLWAVLIIEKVRQTDAFTYEVGFKRVFKTGDRTIRVWVRNDPADQSDDANVLGYIVPNPKELIPIERQMCELAAKRIYDSISATWTGANNLTEEPTAIGATDPCAPYVDEPGLALYNVA